MNTLNLPQKVYFKTGAANVALRELKEVYHLKRAFLVSDPSLVRSGLTTRVDVWLRKQGIRTAEFFSLGAVPSFSDIRSAFPKLMEFEPDVIVGIGGGGVMSAAKVMRLFCENPALTLGDMCVNPVVSGGGFRTKLVLLATSFDSGAQCSPFAVLKDDAEKNCLVSGFSLLPEISVTDSDLAAGLSSDQILECGRSLLSMSVRAFLSAECGEFVQGLLRETVSLILRCLKPALDGCPVALERLHNAGALAGAACGNIPGFSALGGSPYPTDSEMSSPSARAELLAQMLGFACLVDFQNACGTLGK